MGFVAFQMAEVAIPLPFPTASDSTFTIAGIRGMST
jgi:hypothetical protein